jgi:hypothetical protein
VANFQAFYFQAFTISEKIGKMINGNNLIPFKMTYPLPPIAINAKGDQRTVGLELEFTGIEIERAAEIIQQLYGGRLKKKHRYHFEIFETDLGDFRVELDARILRKMADQNIFDIPDLNFDEQSIRKSIEDVVDKVAKAVVPLEIVMPPVKISDLNKLEKLREALLKNKAKGTKGSLVHAFGMHINIESPDLEIPTLLRYLRSFLIMYPWLLEELKIDITRRISTFIDPFPDKYVRKVLNPSYQPDRDRLIKDYIKFNPTRNRPLDMMPIFGMLNKELIQPVMEGEKNDPRPTFHYRLPNSHIDNPVWSFKKEWNYWFTIEKLADDHEMLFKLSRLYLLRIKETVISFRKEWAETLTILLNLDE